jgi:ATP-dependent DNA helicase RecG
LGSEIQYLKGAGPVMGQRLRTLGIERVRDLLFHLPARYQDRRSFTPIARLRPGFEAMVRARVLGARVSFRPRPTLQVLVEEEGVTLTLRMFHFTDAQRQGFREGRWVRAFAPVRWSGQQAEMIHPEYRLADDPAELDTECGWVPIYPLATGITQARVRLLVTRALELLAGAVEFDDAFPQLGPPDTRSALRLLHQPPPSLDVSALLEPTHPARLRLIREELVAHQLAMRILRGRAQRHEAVRIGSGEASLLRLQEHLPFAMTVAQRRVISEVARDLASGHPMMRLLQGDVGSGKTVVAASAMLACAQSKAQAILMAPTELLAEQHARTLGEWMAPFGVSVGSLTAKLKPAQRREALAAAASGSVSLWVGTHALFQQPVAFHNLALVVVDEQHRFGVGQRLALRDKAAAGAAHQLIMSATPIPRTLAQALYADLDVSIIDELPPGRSPVVTVAISSERREQVLERIGEACAGGRQAYWVCTLIEESDTLEAQAAEATAAQLREDLPHLQIGLVHGRLKSIDKEAQMRAFSKGISQVLVATTVIEVGVDVPRASIMVIDNAERLGLAQLHQLRGRVGRGAEASQCVLLYQPPLSDAARSRLEVMRTTHDGFKIAQHDLELRGPGELLGRRQTGLVGLKVADPMRDGALIPGLQKVADDCLARTPLLAHRLIERWVGSADRYAQV